MVSKKNIFDMLKLNVIAVINGIIGGLTGGCFAQLISFVTEVRMSATWLIFLLPVGGIITVWLYSVTNMNNYSGTNDMIRYMEKGYRIRPVIAPLIFISSLISHFLGASSGREGAAIQLGGAGASGIADIFHLRNDKRKVVILSGMSAVFAGVFCTPLTAAVFILEFRTNKKVFSLSVLPCFISSVIAAMVSEFIGTAEETAVYSVPDAVSFVMIVKLAALVVAVSILGFVMCFVFHNAAHLSKKILKNSYIRIVAGAAVMIALTFAVGDMRYNGAGMDMAMKAVEGEADRYDFLLKMLFTAVTLAAGFKGGEIVPTFCIGATFGCVFGGFMGLDAGFAAVLGLVCLFCCVTASPLGAVLLSFELFGITILPYSIPACLLAWLLSGKEGLFVGRFFASPVFGRIRFKKEKAK